MSRSICAISGVIFATEHTPNALQLTSREIAHPIFSASYQQLVAVCDDYIDNKLSPTESYLLYLSLFNITDMVQFRTPVQYTPLTQSIITANMPALMKMVDMIIHVGTGRCKSQLLLPTFVINSETNTLTNSADWIQIWKSAYLDYLDDYKSSIHLQKIADKEARLEAAIKDRSKDISSYVKQLASWAYDIGNFSQYKCTVFGKFNPDKTPMLLGDYWKSMIIACADKSDIFATNEDDLEELLEVISTDLPIASSGIFGHTLIALLESSLNLRKNMFRLGDIDITAGGVMYKILDPDADVEDAAKSVLITNAPTSAPVITDYPNKLAYLKARTKYDMAQKYAASDALRAAASSAITGAVTEAISNTTVVDNNKSKLDALAVKYKGTEL